jgi:hypothetical protein
MLERGQKGVVFDRNEAKTKGQETEFRSQKTGDGRMRRPDKRRKGEVV